MTPFDIGVEIYKAFTAGASWAGNRDYTAQAEAADQYAQKIRTVVEEIIEDGDTGLLGWNA